MTGQDIHSWHTTLVKRRPLFGAEVIRPADISNKLREVMLTRQYFIEDALYRKIVPNRFVVEINPENYTQNFQPIEARILKQWREKLVEDLETANSRQGRLEYSFSGRVEIQIKPAAGIAPGEARILSQAGDRAGAAGEKSLRPGQALGCLEILPGGQRFRLHPGVVSIGRDKANDLALEMEPVLTHRLVSGQHAYIRCEEGQCQLFDGNLEGRASVNGTYVNSRLVPAEGCALQEGDIIILAAVNRDHPRSDTPGVVTLRFQRECEA
jgi:hypothetical protein